MVRTTKDSQIVSDWILSRPVLWAGGGDATEAKGQQNCESNGLTNSTECPARRTLWGRVRDTVAGSLIDSNFVCERIDRKAVSPDATSISVTDPVRLEVLKLYTALSSIGDDEMDSGYRLDAIESALNRASLCHPFAEEAISRVMASSTDGISDETRSAMVRYLATWGESSRRWRMTLFIGSLDSDSEAQAIAAARSLAEYGDWGVVPAIREKVEKTRNSRLKRELEKASIVIESVHGTGANSAA